VPLHNAGIAAIFEEITDLLEIEGDNLFRIRAYRNAARPLRDLGHEITTMLEQGEDLTELPGIGTDLAAKIAAIVTPGSTPLLNQTTGDSYTHAPEP
jgi:DNA polymerase (family 10)